MPELEVIDKRSLSGLKSLTELHAFNNVKLHTIHSAALTSIDEENEFWPPISKLMLNNNQLTHLERHFLVDWDRLREMDLRGNPWTCECENQWFLELLMPVYLHCNETEAKELKYSRVFLFILFVL